MAADGSALVLVFPGLSPALNSPQALAVDGSGNLYVADSNNSRIVELAGGVASVVPTASLLSYPDGVAVDAAGNLYIADGTNNDIVEVPAGGAAAVLSISGLSPIVSQPGHLAVDVAGNLYIADSGNNRIAVVAAGGAGTVFNIPGGLTLSVPIGVAVDALGTVYIADTSNNRVVTVNTAGTVQVVYTDTTVLSFPRGVAVSVGGAIYIADNGNSQIVEVQRSTVGFGHLPYGAVSGTTLTLPFSVANGVVLSSVQVLTLGTPSLAFTANLGAGCASMTTNGGGCPSAPCVAGTTGTQLCTVDVTFLPTAQGLRRGAIVFFDSSAPPAPVLTVPLYGTGDAPLAALNPGIASVIGTGGVITEFPFQLALDGAGNMFLGNYVQTVGNPKVVKVAAGGGDLCFVRVREDLEGGREVWVRDQVRAHVITMSFVILRPASGAVPINLHHQQRMMLGGVGMGIVGMVLVVANRDQHVRTRGTRRSFESTPPAPRR